MKTLIYATPKVNVEITLPEEAFNLLSQFLVSKVAKIKVVEKNSVNGLKMDSQITVDEFI